MKKKALKSYFNKQVPEAGVDEAGRGCLAGPVFAAAVILPKKFRHSFLTDSKQLSRKQREELRPLIEREAISWCVGRADVNEIDSINILQATFMAMHRAIEGLQIPPEFLLIDGNRFKSYPGIQHKTIVEGDSIYFSIAAASVLAKTSRDDHMEQLHSEFPEYGWNTNKGYATLLHRQAISLYGPTDHHRRSFTLLSVQPELFSAADFEI